MFFTRIFSTITAAQPLAYLAENALLQSFISAAPVHGHKRDEADTMNHSHMTKYGWASLPLEDGRSKTHKLSCYCRILGEL